MKIVKKPWGNFKQFVLNKKCTVKIITVNPHGVLSLQKHKKRKEMWYFITNGYVQIGNKKRKVKQGEIVKIGKGVKHRLFAKWRTVKILEISFGHFDENDIMRLEDVYGRVKKKSLLNS